MTSTCAIHTILILFDNKKDTVACLNKHCPYLQFPNDTAFYNHLKMRGKFRVCIGNVTHEIIDTSSRKIFKSPISPYLSV